MRSDDSHIPARPHTVTTTALLDRLLEPGDKEVWEEFDRRYRPIILGFARRLGLSLEDAEDAAQETVMRVVKHYPSGGYDRERGRLRSWMLGIARRCIIDIQQARSERLERRGLSAIVDIPGEDRLESILEEECKRAVRDRALGELKQETRFDDRTIRAFELLVFAGRKVSDVASELSMSVDSVYASKHRCARELRKIVDRLEPLYEMG
jgi:RNA polymerase sigma-70 factor (ECF subfamily)